MTILYGNNYTGGALDVLNRQIIELYNTARLNPVTSDVAVTILGQIVQKMTTPTYVYNPNVYACLISFYSETTLKLALANSLSQMSTSTVSRLSDNFLRMIFSIFSGVVQWQLGTFINNISVSRLLQLGVNNLIASPSLRMINVLDVEHTRLLYTADFYNRTQ